MYGKRAAAVDIGRSAAANPVTDPQLHTRRIVSAATLHAVFVEGKVDGVPASILVGICPPVLNF